MSVNEALRQAVLNHRCPNCGVTMQKNAPKRSWWSIITMVAVTLAMVAGMVDSIGGHWSAASFDVSVAIFLVVVDR